MHRTHITACLIALAAVAGCSDDAPKPTISDDTGWQLICDPDSGACSGRTSHGEHKNRESEDIAIAVRCSRLENGLSIQLTDPGADPPTETRRYSRIEIERLDPELNRCTVTVTESTSTGELEVTGSCGTQSTSACTVQGEVDSDGWSFDGTIECKGMNYNTGVIGLGPFGLRAPGSTDAPIVLKIANCD